MFAPFSLLHYTYTLCMLYTVPILLDCNTYPQPKETNLRKAAASLYCRLCHRVNILWRASFGDMSAILKLARRPSLSPSMPFSKNLNIKSFLLQSVKGLCLVTRLKI